MSGTPGQFDENAISDLHAQHYRTGTPVQRLLDTVVGKLSHPAMLMVMIVSVVVWISTNLIMLHYGIDPFDPPPFLWMHCGASVGALFLAALILTTQRHEDGLSRHRDQLTLEMAILSERKSAKIIELLEEHRRDNPMVKDRVDEGASAMARPHDPSAVLTAIEEVQRTVTAERK